MITRFAVPLLVILCLCSCSSSKKAGMLDSNTFKLTAVSDDASYGFTEQNAVKVGGAKNSEGPVNERRFLNALLGPEGQQITYHRRGSCCPFNSPNGLMGSGLLDIYEVSYEGLDKPLLIYINMYDKGELKAPKGFTFRQ